jgi:hypothetical protein
MVLAALSTLIAHKAINLATDLSNSEKRVAGAIIDHFNRRTGQCDPSLDRIAGLIGMSRRTVIRAISRLVKFGYFRRVRHGGHFHRNSYEPVWSRFSRVEAEWNARRNVRRVKFAASKVSPCSGQSGHLPGDTAVSQTLLNNPTKKTLDEGMQRNVHQHIAQNEQRGSAGKAHHIKYFSERLAPPITRSATAALDAAERRWNEELFDRYGDQPFIYGQIAEAIDLRLSAETTEAEMRQRGSGLSYLMNQLLARDTTIINPPKGGA